MNRIRFFLGLMLLAFACMAGVAQADLLPVGQWDLNEGAGTVAHNDYPFRSGAGTLQGGASWTSGRFAGALAFDGTGSVDVAESSALGPASVTVSAWVESNGSPGAYRYIAVKGGNACCTGSYGLYTGLSGGLEFYVSSGATTYVVSPDAGTGVWDGTWHNIVGTFDGAYVRLYVDGRQVGTGTADSSPIDYQLPSGGDFVIGNYPWCPGLGFSGSIDEVKVFDRALGPAEIGLGYLASRYVPSYYPFDLIF